MRKLFTAENLGIAVLAIVLSVVVLAAQGFFDGPPFGVVYDKSTIPPTKHCTYYEDGRIQKMPVDARFFIIVRISDGWMKQEWEVPKYVYDNAELGEIWDKP